LFSIALTGLPAAGPALPEKLRVIEPVDVAGAEVQSLSLTEMSVGGEMELGINGVPASQAEPIFAMAGETQVWEVINTTMADHPFHLHGFSFQVLEDNGAGARYGAWKDTLNVRAGTSVRLGGSF